MSYFSNFPTITYANVVVTDVTRRVTFPASILRQPTAFSPYTVEDGQRADLVSYMYYGQDDDDWMIMLANQVVDPYYGWYMSVDEFNRFIVSKYGSLQDAQQRVSNWVTNWATDPRVVSTGYYQALTQNLRRYWVPNFGQGTTILSYSRREEDWTASTNQILEFTTTSAAPHRESELAQVFDTQGNFQGTGEVLYVSGDTVAIGDVTGTWANGYSVQSWSGSSVIQATGAPDLVIPIDEVVYFSAVSCYDMEYDRNEQNKEVLLVQDAYRGIMYSELTAGLNSPAP